MITTTLDNPTRPSSPLKARRVLFYSALMGFLVWVALLGWLYLTQIALKH